MQAGARVGEDVTRAAQALGYDGAEATLSDAMRWLEGAGDHIGDLAGPALSALGRALSELGEAQEAVARLSDQLDHDPAELERVEERLFAIRALARKHDVAADELADLTKRLSTQLAGLDAADADDARLRADLTEARAAYAGRDEALAKARSKAAKALDRAMAQELAPLKMERAVFSTEVTATDAGPDGSQAVQFQVATNPGAPSGALNKIASGGELSRFLLALKVCLAGDATGLTMIFDEIDRGVGGATADAVGRRLAALATGGQVLVVTHSPQVAALGGYHLRVEKQVKAKQTQSTVTALDADARVDEIARMLAGDRVTEEARGAARALLQPG